MVWHVLDLSGAGTGKLWAVVNTFMKLRVPKHA